jgi:hypothetical protein
MVTLSHPATAVPTIMEHLRTGGATDLRTATNHVWIVGRAPSGRLMQVLWDPTHHGYYVSHWPPGQMAAEPLGVFPEPEAAVARALQA